jgi:hypothetical protein
MLMHHTRGAVAQAALEAPQFGPISAHGSDRPDDAAAAAGSLELRPVTDPTYSLRRGGGEIDATDHSPRAGEWNRDFVETLVVIAGHDLRQPLQIITGTHEIPRRLGPVGTVSVNFGAPSAVAARTRISRWASFDLH